MSSIRSEPIPTSDTESVDEALLSPSDGFFNSSTVPDELHVPDPHHSNTQADKEREARQEQQPQATNSAAATQAPLRFPAQAPSRSLGSLPDEDDVNERTPLISNAPPAYTDIVQDTNTNLEAGTMGRETAFFPNRDPQDLGGAQEPLLDHPQRRNRSSWRAYLTDGNKLGKLLVIICCVLLFLAALGKIVDYVSQPRVGLMLRSSGAG
jgi:hypothetical protein